MAGQRATIDLSALFVAVIGVILLAPIAAILATRGGLPVAGFGIVVVLILILIWRPSLGPPIIVLGVVFDQLRVDVGFASLGAGDITTLLVVPSWLVSNFIKRHRVTLPKGMLLLLIYLAWVVLSMIAQDISGRAYGDLARLGTYFLGFLVIVDQMSTSRHLKRIIVILAVSGVIHALAGILMESRGVRAEGIPGQSNLLALWLVTGILCAFALAIRTQSILQRGVWLGGMLLMLGTLVLTISRGNMIALTIAMLWWSRHHRRFAALTLVLAVVVFVGLQHQSDTLNMAEVSARFEMRDRSVLQRKQVLLNALKTIEEYPFFGVGYQKFGQLDQVIYVQTDQGRSAHNYYVGTMASTGVPSLLLLLLFVLGQALVHERLKRRATRRGDLETKWLIQAIQAIMVAEVLTLVTRGGGAVTGFMFFGLYAAATRWALKVEADYTSERQDEPRVQPLGESAVVPLLDSAPETSAPR